MPNDLWGVFVILVAGLTPAWQQILSFQHFELGEVNRADQAFGCASGKVLNVGCALHHLGIPAKTVSPVGGITGLEIQADFERLGIPVRWVKADAPIRVCTTILDQQSGSTTELVENSNPLSATELDAYAAAFAEEVRSAEVVVLTGSVPSGTPPDYLRRLLALTSAKAVLDIRGEELEQTLPLKPYVVKPNSEELGKTVGRKLDSEASIIDAMSELRARGAQWVVISQGAKALLALGPEGLLRVQPPKVDVCNPIGCGDCLAAGIAAGIHLGEPMQRCLEIGVQAAAENAQVLLPARSLTRLR